MPFGRRESPDLGSPEACLPEARPPEDRLTRLGQDWYADVRRRHGDPEVERRRRSSKPAGDGDDCGLLGWLLGDADGDGDCGDGGD